MRDASSMYCKLLHYASQIWGQRSHDEVREPAQEPQLTQGICKQELNELSDMKSGHIQMKSNLRHEYDLASNPKTC